MDGRLHQERIAVGRFARRRVGFHDGRLRQRQDVAILHHEVLRLHLEERLTGQQLEENARIARQRRQGTPEREREGLGVEGLADGSAAYVAHSQSVLRNALGNHELYHQRRIYA